MKSGCSKRKAVLAALLFWSCGGTAPRSVTCRRQSRQVSPHADCRVNPVTPEKGLEILQACPAPVSWPGSCVSVVHLRHRLDCLGLIDDLFREIADRADVSRRASNRNTGGRCRRGQQGGRCRHQDGADSDRGDGEEGGLAGEIFAVDHGGLLVSFPGWRKSPAPWRPL